MMQGVSKSVTAILSFALLALTGSAVSAADIPARVEKAHMYAVPIQSWSSFYLGLNGGGGVGSANPAMAGSSFTTQGWVYGAQIGYNVQMGRVVLGLEGDIDATSFNGTTSAGACGLGCEVRNRWVGTMRGRAGVTVDSFLPYLTGGLALGDLTASNAGTGSTSTTRTGYALGAGLEFPITGRWSARGEYLFVDLGSLDCAGCGGPVPNRASFYTNMYRAAVNFRF